MEFSLPEPLRRRKPVCILCLNCNCILSDKDKKSFYKKGLKVVRRQNDNVRKCYGYCEDCCWEIAAREANHCMNDCITLEVEGALLYEGGKQLEDLVVWCQYCLHNLNFAEKCMNRDMKFPLIRRRGRWRGTCGGCVFTELQQNA